MSAFGSARGYNALPANRRAPSWAADSRWCERRRHARPGRSRPARSPGGGSGIDFGIDDDAFALAALTSPGDLAGSAQADGGEAGRRRAGIPARWRARRPSRWRAMRAIDSHPTACCRAIWKDCCTTGDPRWAHTDARADHRNDGQGVPRAVGAAARARGRSRCRCSAMSAGIRRSRRSPDVRARSSRARGRRRVAPHPLSRARIGASRADAPAVPTTRRRR